MSAISPQSSSPQLPSGQAPPAPPWGEALDRLVTRGVITPEQRDAIAGELGTLPAGPPPPAPRFQNVRDRLIEAGAYLGAAFVAAAAFVLAAQNWEDLTRNGRIALTASTAIVALILAAIVAVAHHGGLSAARQPEHAARARLFGVLTSVAALAGAATAALIVGDDPPHQNTFLISVSVAIVIVVAAQLLVPNQIGELATFLASALWVAGLGQSLDPEWNNYQDKISAYDRIWPWAMVAFGVGWAVLAPRVMTMKTAATALGAFFAFQATIGYLSNDQLKPGNLVLAAIVSALSFWMFSTTQRWPWIVLALISLTGFVYQLVGGRDNQALAFLVAGLVLLGASGAGVRLRRKHEITPH